MADKGTVTGPAAKTVFEEMFKTGQSAKEIVAGRASPRSAMPQPSKAVRDIIDQHPQTVADFKAGRNRR